MFLGSTIFWISVAPLVNRSSVQTEKKKKKKKKGILLGYHVRKMFINIRDFMIVITCNSLAIGPLFSYNLPHMC